MLTLVLGGARSGKSRFAQTLCQNSEKTIYLATARPDSFDTEMAARIGRHQADRPENWLTVEEPLEIARAVSENAAEDTIILLDCITVWLSNLMWEHRTVTIERREEIILSEVGFFVDVANRGNVIAVSNEVGGGIVPASETAREFRDLQGFANQLLAAKAERVYLVVAGLPLTLKS